MTHEAQLFAFGGRRRTAGQHLRLMLDVDGAICAPYPNHIFWDMRAVLPLYGNLDDDQAYRMLIRHVIGSYRVALEAWRAPLPDADDLLCRLRDRPVRNIHAISSELLSREAAARGAAIALDKSPDTIVDWPQVMAARPET